MDLGSLFGGADDNAQNDTSAATAATTPAKRTRKGKETSGGPTPLSAREANDLKEQLIELLAQGFDDTDKLITHTNADKAAAAIWSTVDDQEIEILATAWVEWGKTSAQGARIVKLVVKQWHKYKVAIILGPRFLETINFYAEHGAALPMKKKRTRAGTQAHTQASAQAPAPVVDPNIAAEQAQAAHQAQLAARRNLIASGANEGASHDAA